VRSKSAASKIVESMKTSHPSINASIREPVLAAVVKQVPRSLDCSGLLQIISKSTKKNQQGATPTFKAQFGTRSELDFFLKESVRIGYERLPVQEFIFLPCQCFKCHELGHLAVNCQSSTLCGRFCSASHVSDRSNACTASKFFTFDY
jgi:hypothetical protein